MIIHSFLYLIASFLGSFCLLKFGYIRNHLFYICLDISVVLITCLYFLYLSRCKFPGLYFSWLFSLVQMQMSLSILVFIRLYCLYLFRCKCPPGFDGPRCQTTRVSFKGKGWMSLPKIGEFWEKMTDLFDLSDGIEIRTR